MNEVPSSIEQSERLEDLIETGLSPLTAAYENFATDSARFLAKLATFLRAVEDATRDGVDITATGIQIMELVEFMNTILADERIFDLMQDANSSVDLAPEFRTQMRKALKQCSPEYIRILKLSDHLLKILRKSN